MLLTVIINDSHNTVTSDDVNRAIGTQPDAKLLTGLHFAVWFNGDWSTYIPSSRSRTSQQRYLSVDLTVKVLRGCGGGVVRLKASIHLVHCRHTPMAVSSSVLSRTMISEPSIPPISSMHTSTSPSPSPVVMTASSSVTSAPNGQQCMYIHVQN